MRSIYILILITLLATACEKEIAYKGSKLENFMVLNALIENDSIIKCQVTHSNTLFENSEIRHIDDATVELYNGNELLETLTHIKDGYYHSTNLKASAQASYTIKARHKDYTNINATATVPEATNAAVSNIRYNQKDGMYDVTLTINDKKGTDYYRLMVYTSNEYYNEYNNNSGYSFVLTYIDSNDPVLNFNKVGGDDSGISDYPDNTYSVFNDDLFDGETYKLKFKTYGAEGSPLKVELQHITEDLYLYYSSVQSRDYYEESPFSEPVRIHSNVENGAGIMGGVCSTASLKILSEQN